MYPPLRKKSIHQERLNDDLEHLEMSITHTDVDDNLIPITFDLTLIPLARPMANTYSHTIQDWIEKHPIRIVDRRSPSAIEPPFGFECIRIRWTGSGVDIWSSHRFFDTIDPPQVNRSKSRRPHHMTQTNTIAKYFQPIKVGPPRKREGQAQKRTSSKVNPEDR